ncbi:unnamed protein product, partial [Brenthis ino]
MRWCFCKHSITTVNTVNCKVEDLKKKEMEISLKECELKNKERYLENKIVELNRLTDCKVKKQLAAAVKLDNARKLLLNAVNNKDKNEKNQKCKCYKSHKKSKREFKKPTQKLKSEKEKQAVDIVHNFFDNFFKIDRDMAKLSKINTEDFITKFKRILLKPYTFPPFLCNTCRCRPEFRHQQRRKWDVAAGDCYLMTLRKTPQLWIYHRWPRLYPKYLSTRAQCKNVKFLLTLFLGFLFWIPCFICLEICKCCLCFCCSDC